MPTESFPDRVVRKFSFFVLVRVARSFSGDVAIYHVLPVLWITLYLHVTGLRVAASDVIASSCA